MRLHLPKALLAAVLAACLAWPAGAFTSTTTNYPTDSSTPTTFNGDIWTWNNSGTNIGSGDGAKFTNYSTGTEYAGNASNTGGPAYFYNYFFNGSETETDHLGNTLRFSGATENKTLMTDWSNYVWIGGIITEAGNYSYTLGRDGGTNFKLNGQNAVNMIINSSFTFKTNSSSSVAVEKGGTWSIAKGKSLTFDTGTTTIAVGQMVNVSASGDGTGNASLTFSGAVTNNGTLNIGSNVLFSTSNTITNTGSITFASGATINLDSFQPTSTTLNDSDTTGVKTWSGSWTLATGGTVTAENGVNYQYKGKLATSGSISGGVISANGKYFNIISGDEKSYAEATADSSINFINVLGELSGLSGSIATEIRGSGTLSMSAGSGQVTIAAEKLTGFTGDLIVNSGRFNKADNGHVFSNVTVTEGGQFFINDGYNYTGNVSIAGTGWSNTGDKAWNGALRLGLNSTLSGKLTLTGDACIMAHNGANVTLAGEVDARDRTLTAKGTGTLNFGGNATIGSLITDSVSVAVNGGGTLSILKDSNLQKLYSNGAATITLGDGTNSAITTASRIELSDDRISANTTTLTVSANSVLKITGANNTDDYKTASALLGEWNARTTATINGTLLSEGAALQAGDAGYTLNIETTGLVAAKGIKRAQSDKNPTITVNLKGGSLILGDGGIAANGTNHSATSTGGVIGSYADTTTIASALSLTSGTTTIDTSKYTINADNTVTVPTTGATGSTITISGNISGSSGTKLEVTGEGEVILSGTNTLQDLVLSGGTTTIIGTTTVRGNTGDSKDRKHGIVADNDTLTLTVSGILRHDDFKYEGSVLSGLSNGLSMWNNNGSGKVTVSGGTVEQTAETYKDVRAALKDVKLINASGMETRLYAGAELSGASISGTLLVGGNTTTTIKNSVTGSTDSSIATLTGSGTLKTTGGTTTVTNASGFSGTLEATTGGSLEANGTTTGDSGTVTLSSLAGLKATGGSIELAGVAATLTVTDLVVAGNGSISGAESYTANKVSIGAGEAGSLVGNLSIQDGGTITLDASAGATTATGGTKGLSLSALTTTYADEGTTTTTGSLTLGSGLTLNLANLGRLAQGETLTLFSGVTEVIGLTDENLTALGQGTLAAETVFSSGVGTGNYNLRYSGNVVSLVAQKDTPEPTTATLSLLALMALAARRRRKA